MRRSCHFLFVLSISVVRLWWIFIAFLDIHISEQILFGIVGLWGEHAEFSSWQRSQWLRFRLWTKYYVDWHYIFLSRSTGSENLEVAPTSSRSGSRHIAICSTGSRDGSHAHSIFSAYHLFPGVRAGDQLCHALSSCPTAQWVPKVTTSYLSLLYEND